jgi:DNA polymerase-3 subunit gamma/tau
MSVLRMLAFRPAPATGEGKGEAVPTTRQAASMPAATTSAASKPSETAPVRAVADQAAPAAAPRPAAAPAADDDTPPWPVEPPRAASSAPAAIAPSQAMAPPPPPPAPAPVAATPPPAPMQDTHPADRDFAFSSDIGITNADVWMHFASNSELKGATRQLVENAAFVGYDSGVLQLSLDPGFDYLRSERSVRDLGDAIAQRYGTAPKIVFQAAPAGSETLRQRTDRERGEQQIAAEQDFMNHPDVQRLIEQHGAKVVPDSIRPFEE